MKAKTFETRWMLLAFALMGNGAAWAQTASSATESTTEQQAWLDEVSISADPKMVGSLASQPQSYSVIGATEMEQQGIRSLKSATQFVPNLYMPDYGSRLTSSLYIRGVGSRINTPAVGMYVDDVAYKERSAFDLDFSDVERIEVLRGPQSTLYGRNAMGGLLKVYTFDPLTTRRLGRQTQLRIGASTEDAGRYVNFRTANMAGDDAAFSFSGFYDGNDGYNRNTWLNRRSNGSEAGGAKFRYVYNPLRHRGFTADFQTSIEYSNENAYDYYKVADIDEGSYTPGGIGEIRSGKLGNYRRTLLNNSLKLQTIQRHFVLTSVSAWQYLTDRMFMDQDFSPADLFTLEQRQHSHSLSEELVVKSHGNDRLEWLGGVYVAQQWLKTDAPVHFGADGIQQMIQNGIDRGFDAANAAMGAMGMNIDMHIDDKSMLVDGLFDTPTFNAAAFGQATLKNLLPKLNVTAGIRVDYEHTKLTYDTGATSNFTFAMMRNGIPMINSPFSSTSRYDGVIRHDYTQVLPRVTLSYDLPNKNLVYATVSKGFRSGGYNIQKFGDMIPTSLKNEMMATLAADPVIGPSMSRYGMAAGENPSADSTTVFKPETSWNYEVGTHLQLFNGHATVTASAFYILTKDQQIARFASSGLGRQMVNAGKSRSYGGEISLSTWMSLWRNPLTLRLSYGYTHATFTDYDLGDVDYTDNYVPFAPQHTFSAAVGYMVNMKHSRLDIGVDATGLGRTYWTEDNRVSEPLYVLLGAHAGIHFDHVSVRLWGKNLTDKAYVPFYYESMSQGFAQTSRPRQAGIDVTVRF